MTDVGIARVDDNYIRVVCPPDVAHAINEKFTYEVAGSEHMRRRNSRYRSWDGTIRLFNLKRRTIYAGLREEVEKFLREEDCNVSHLDAFDRYEVDPEGVEDWIASMKISRTPRQYQVDCLIRAMENRRGVFLSPTGTGKSLIIYMVARMFDVDTLLVVPTIGLVNQMQSDLVDYGMDPNDIHCIMGGTDKEVQKRVTITTWQSAYKQPEEWFSRFRLVIGDEVHTWKAKSLIELMMKMPECPNRFGFTGTLDGTEVNELVITGLFGPVYQATTTMEQVEAGNLARPIVNVISLRHPEHSRRACYAASYQDEMDIIVSSLPRLRFVRNLALSCKGNTLVLFNYVEKHGIPLHQDVVEHAKGRRVHLVHGGVAGDEREEIRLTVEHDEDAIILASYGTFQLGVNIVNLHNLILASPSKSQVRVLQSIGRGLRVGEKKKTIRIYDVADDLRQADWRNFTLNHLTERIRIYAREGFDYRLNAIDI